MCQYWRIGRRPRAATMAAAAASAALIEWRNRDAVAPSSSSAARASIRPKSVEPIPRRRCAGWTTPHEPTTSGSSRLTCPYATISPRASVTAQASAARSRSGRLLPAARRPHPASAPRRPPRWSAKSTSPTASASLRVRRRVIHQVGPWRDCMARPGASPTHDASASRTRARSQRDRSRGRDTIVAGHRNSDSLALRTAPRTWPATRGHEECLQVRERPGYVAMGLA